MFFDYDEVDYYSIDITENDAMKLDSLSKFSKTNQLKYDLISNDFPDKLYQIDFEKKIEKVGYKMKSIGKNDFKSLNKIFIEKTYQDGITFACIPVYRDILIFKKNKKIIGFTKICFDCHQYVILGSSANTDNFGYDSDYENLGKILDKYSN